MSSQNCCSRVGIMTSKTTRIEERFESMLFRIVRLFFINYMLHCSMRLRVSTYKDFSSIAFTSS